MPIIKHIHDIIQSLPMPPPGPSQASFPTNSTKAHEAKTKQAPVSRSKLSSSRIRPIHRRNLPGDRRPLQFPLDRLAALLLLNLIPFEEFVGEAEVGLDDDVEAAGADVAAEVPGVSFRKGGA